MPEDKKLYVSVSPHVRDRFTVPSIMGAVLIALTPIALYALYLFGLAGLLVMASCVFGAMFTETVWRRFSEKDRLQRLYIDLGILALLIVVTTFSPDLGGTIQWVFIAIMAVSVLDDMNTRKAQKKCPTDGSAVVTGLLLSFTLPPLAPWWVGAVGSAIAISLGKQLFGGLGFNIFNPALVGRAVLLMSWPNFLTTTWFKNLAIDGLASATPLALAKDDMIINYPAYYGPLLWGNTGGCIGEISAALLIAGGLFLIATRVIDWRIPAGYLGTVAAMALVFKVDPVFHLIAGGVMVGAFFMATDYVTTCTSPRGKLIFGIGCGLITMLLRLRGGSPEAVTFAILFMNMCAPLIDRMVRPRVFGEVKAA